MWENMLIISYLKYITMLKIKDSNIESQSAGYPQKYLFHVATKIKNWFSLIEQPAH